LTANLQLRRSSQPRAGHPKISPGVWGRSPHRDESRSSHRRRAVRRCAVLVESRSMTPPQQCLPATALFAPGRACDIASDVPCRDPRRARHRCRAPSALGPPDPRPRPSRQRPPARRARTPSIVRVLPPPVVLAFSRLHVGSRRARHRFRCSRARGFRHREPASDASSLAEPAHLSVFAPAS